MLFDELKPHFEAIKKKLKEQGPLPHAARALLSVENAELQVGLFDRREKYLAETHTPAKDTILILLESDANRPVRKQVLRVTEKHIVVAWHERDCTEHHFSVDTGVSLERPRENGRRLPHSIDLAELAALRQTRQRLQR